MPRTFNVDFNDPERIKRRFWAKVTKTPDCWLWQGRPKDNGYGLFRAIDYQHYAHRFSWELHFGPIPEGSGYHGMCVLHKCDNRLCVRPDHLFLGTNYDNVQDMHKKGRARKAIGEKSSSARYTEEHIHWIKRLRARGWSTVRLARVFDCYSSTIHSIVNGKTWKHVP